MTLFYREGVQDQDSLVEGMGARWRGWVLEGKEAAAGGGDTGEVWFPLPWILPGERSRDSPLVPSTVAPSPPSLGDIQ